MKKIQMASGVAILLSLSAWAQPAIPKCDPISFNYLTDQTAVDPASGTVVVPINRNVDGANGDLTIWDLNTGVLLDTVTLARRSIEYRVVGFPDANTFVILTWDPNHISGPALIQYKIKEKQETLLWDDLDKDFHVFDYSFTGNTAYVGIGMFPYQWATLDLLHGNITLLSDSSAIYGIKGAYASDGKSYFGIETESYLPNGDPSKLHADVTRWAAPGLNSPSPVTSFTAKDYGVEGMELSYYPDPTWEVRAGGSGNSLYFSDNVTFSDHHRQQNYVHWVDLAAGSKMTCAFPADGAAGFEVLEDRKHLLLVSDTVIQNYQPVILNAATCETQALPPMTGFSDVQYRPTLRAEEVQGRSILYSFQRFWDAKTGKLLLTTCQ